MMSLLFIHPEYIRAGNSQHTAFVSGFKFIFSIPLNMSNKKTKNSPLSVGPIPPSHYPIRQRALQICIAGYDCVETSNKEDCMRNGFVNFLKLKSSPSLRVCQKNIRNIHLQKYLLEQILFSPVNVLP